jgi:SAM-dependent methyltransferase
VSELLGQFGEIDIYLFDQLLKGRITRGMRILDAGCGYGRNLVYLMKAGYEAHGVDLDPDAVAAMLRKGPNFHVAAVDNMPFADAFADVVISNTVLHFARDDAHFQAMLREMWRVLKPGGMLFCRLGSSIGMERQIVQVQGRRYHSPDGSERYLVNEALLDQAAADLGAVLLDPLKTTIVRDQRAMTTWVLRKTC